MKDKIKIVPADITGKEVIENLFRYYVYEMSDFLQASTSEKGLFEFNNADLNKYWEREDHFPFLIYCDGEIAGFSLLRKYPNDQSCYDIGQFFVLKKFNKQGVGREAFKKSVSQFSGSWITRVLIENKRALTFWLSAISSVTDHEFSHAIEIDDDLPMHFIRFEIESGS